MSRKIYPHQSLEDAAFEQAKQKIKREIGDVTFLPYELLNTVCNIYYLSELSNFDQKYLLKEINLLPYGDIDTLIYQASKLSSNRKHVAGMIDALKQIDPHTEKNLFKFSVNFALDVLKYDIENAEHKSEIRRKIERRKMRKYVIEIPDLCEKMNIV